MTTKSVENMDPTTKKNIHSWLDEDYDPKTKQTIRDWLQSDPEKLVDAFYTHLHFGTGGMRGLMGIGSNRMNVYTVRAATQGLANYILKQPVPKELKNHRAMIGYDSRENSKLFAEEVAKVFAGNGIEAHLFQDLRPTPLVSFGVRLRGCTAGVMITASHNPPAYNGYKVSWNDGAQVLPPHDKGIMAEVEKVTSPSKVKSVPSLNNPLIIIEGTEIDIAYLAAMTSLQLHPDENRRFGNKLKVIYSPFHGTGITLAPEALHRWGFTDVEVVKEQATPDGRFPTVKLPNPEDPAAMELGMAQLKRDYGDIFLATDPDADRVGVAVLHQDKVHLLNGNQIACLCLHHILEGLSKQNRLPPKGACVKSITTTDLFKAIAKKYNVTCFEVLTGFKYVVEKIRQWENNPADAYTYLFGAEESYGYLFGTFVRDKDAIISCALIAEVALQAKLEGKTLIDLLEKLYDQYGHYTEELLSISYPETKEGKESMEKAMLLLRTKLPTQFHGRKVLAVEDYLKPAPNSTLPMSDVLIFRLENDGKVIVRPSGTEPKIKVYAALTNATPQELKDLLDSIRQLLN